MSHRYRRHLARARAAVAATRAHGAAFARCESGATAIEYGLIAAGVMVAITSSVKLTGCRLVYVFNQVNNGLQ